nr:Dihydrofolate reductase [uncultured bacterium]
MMLSHVVACSENGVIGKDGGLPWHLPEDLKRFKALTMGHILIMGRKTFDSIGRALPGRYTIVVSRNTTMMPRIVTPAASIDEAIQHASTLTAAWKDEVFIVGGGEIYRQTLPRVQRIYLTKVKMNIDGDTTYPLDSLSDFELKETIEVEDSHPPFTTSILERRS